MYGFGLLLRSGVSDSSTGSSWIALAVYELLHTGGGRSGIYCRRNPVVWSWAVPEAVTLDSSCHRRGPGEWCNSGEAVVISGRPGSISAGHLPVDCLKSVSR